MSYSYSELTQYRLSNSTDDGANGGLVLVCRAVCSVVQQRLGSSRGGSVPSECCISVEAW